MEVVAPGGVTPAPFALSPRHHLLAVGMASSAAARGAESGAARVDVLRLLGPGGDHRLGKVLHVDCVLQAPGLRRVAWSATPKTSDDDDALHTLEQLLYPAGLIAGGFEDGTVKVWNPNDAILSDLNDPTVNNKKKPAPIYSEDVEETKVSTGIANMYSEIEGITWTYASQDKDIFQIKEEENMDQWDLLESDAESCDWDLITKDELPVADHHVSAKHMQLVTEARINGPVLGLCFNELYPYWIATGALSERICVHDLNHPMQLNRKTHEFRESGSKSKRQITCLKWSQTYPCLLGSTGAEGFLKVWDVRCPSPRLTFDDNERGMCERGMCSSDLEFSWTNPMHIAVSTVSNGNSAAVKIWDMRYCGRLYREYEFGGSGVVSLSWNRSGHLLAAHKNGSVSCYDVYKDKMLQQLDLPHSDLGITWTHSDNVAATFSSKSGVKLCEIGGAKDCM